MKFDTDLCSDIGQVGYIFHHEVPASGRLGEFLQHPGTCEFLRRAMASLAAFVNTDAVKLHVRFFQKVFYLRLGVAAPVIAAVGNEQENFAGVVGLLQSIQRQINTVEERCSALRPNGQAGS